MSFSPPFGPSHVARPSRTASHRVALRTEVTLFQHFDFQRPKEVQVPEGYKTVRQAEATSLGVGCGGVDGGVVDGVGGGRGGAQGAQKTACTEGETDEI